MSWLKRDDQRCLHPKIGELTDREYRALDALYEYCARTRNGGRYRLTDLRHALYSTPRGPRSPSHQMNAKWLRLCLVDAVDSDVYQVHDWDVYQPKDPTGSERKRLERERKAREGHKTVAGQSSDNPATVTDSSRDSRARGPVPSRPEELKAAAAGTTHDNDPTAAPNDDAAAAEPDEHLELLLDGLGLPDTLRQAARTEPARARAVAEYTIANRGTGGFFRTVFESGDWPTAASNGSDENQPVDPADRRRRFLHGSGYLLPDDELDYQLRQMGASDDDVIEATETAHDLRKAHA